MMTTMTMRNSSVPPKYLRAMAAGTVVVWATVAGLTVSDVAAQAMVSPLLQGSAARVEAATPPPAPAAGEVEEKKTTMSDTGAVALPKLEGRAEYISPGDTVRVMMLEDSEVQYEGPVSVSGTIPVPYYGEFVIAGLTEKEAGDKLAAALMEGLYQQAAVSVILLSRGPGMVYVYGAVGRPGGVPVPQYGQMTILRLVLLSGGLSGWASPEDTFIMRRNRGDGSMQRVSVNLKDIFAEAIPETESDPVLMDGDIVCVPGMNDELYQFMNAQDREIIIIGEVNGPGPLSFSPGETRTVMRAIFKAGGFTQFAKSNAVRIIRYERNQQRTEMVVDAEEIMEKGYLHKDIELQPGDMLIVPQKKINF